MRRIIGALVGTAAIALSFTAGAQAATPTAVTGTSTGVTNTSAVLHGRVDPEGAVTDYTCNSGPTPSYGAATVARMKAMPTDDDCFGKGSIREDGRKIHPCYLFQVKKPSESKGRWDDYNLIATIPAEQAFRPSSEGGCPLAAGMP